jgi:hypothetical protein
VTAVTCSGEPGRIVKKGMKGKFFILFSGMMSAVDSTGAWLRL